jgi:hypothetical protein
MLFIFIYLSFISHVLNIKDKGNGGQQACPEEWKKYEEEHE